MERQFVACDTKSVGARAFQRNEPVPPSRCCWSLHHTTTPNSSLLSSGTTLRRERDRDTQRFGRFGTTSTHLRGLAICLGRKDPASKSPRVCGTVLFLTLIYMLPIPHTLFVFCVCTLSVRPAARFVELKNTARQKVQNSAFLVSDRCTDRTFRLSFRQTPCLPTRSTFVSRRKRVSPASIQIDNASQSATFYVN
jgi:hypothetical protein